ncbi:MAG: UDP-N-acetylglucosamine 2-epimerase (non-hydrolyzing) [Armatimonadetes bacterium]|nr:UDP-N-acetylglucosamine 2-epimerase (non-hydrolyzing) [Armatimonadota bacterium]
MSQPTVALVFGTRPEAIKLAPIYQELKRRERPVQVIVTAQHRGLLDQMLAVFEMTADVDLDIMQEGQTLAQITSRALTGLQETFAKLRPDVVMVQGDTTTVLGGALAAFYERIPVAHVEAGLRTQNKLSPFPEEINRRLTDVISDVYFAATRRARHNLLGEGIPAAAVYVTGNPVVDALRTVVERQPALPEQLKWIDTMEGRLILVTAHRRENLGVPFSRICQALQEIVERHDDVTVVWPLHPNPLVTKSAHELLDGVERVVLTDPLDYLAFVPLMAHADLVITDSGGVQEEAPALGVPALVTRDTTERPEGIEAGVAKLVGTETDAIVAEADRLLNSPNEYTRMTEIGCPYGDGQAAGRICDALDHFLGLRDDRPPDFTWPT